MDKASLIEGINHLYASSELNCLTKENALLPSLVSVKLFEAPLVGIAAAGNPQFAQLKQEAVVGEHFRLPGEWLEGAQSVVSLFFPFTAAIRASNREAPGYPSKGWLNGRIEGQAFISQFTRQLASLLNEKGCRAVGPCVSDQFFANTDHEGHGLPKRYTSNWSERHVAYLCGLGTLSLSKGLITDKGVAGRLTSLITSLPLPPDAVRFSAYDENCILCGRCAANCPAKAISLERGKDHALCSAFLNKVMAENAPWYGCGKCQVDVPCEAGNPRKMTAAPAAG